MKKRLVYLLFLMTAGCLQELPPGQDITDPATADHTPNTIVAASRAPGVAFDTVNTGTGANTGTGDPLRTAFEKINVTINLLNSLGLYEYSNQIDSLFLSYTNPVYDLNLNNKNFYTSGNVGSNSEKITHGYFEDITVTNPLRARIFSDSIIYGDGAIQTIAANNLKDMEILGSSVKAMTLGTDLGETKAQVAMVDNSLKFIPVYVRTAQVITGVYIGMQTQGNYTADNYNGVGLYKYNATLDSLELVASSADDGDIWKASSGAMITKAFSSTYNAAAGLYYVGCLWNASATTAAPSVYGTSPGIWVGSTLSSGYFIAGAETGQNTLPAIYKASEINTSSTSYFVFLY